MGVYTYIAKRKSKNFKSDSGETLKVFPLCWSNKFRDEYFQYYRRTTPAELKKCGQRSDVWLWEWERNLATSHRMSAMAWEDDFANGNIPLVTRASFYSKGKWEPIEDEEVYRFTGGDPSSTIPESVWVKNLWGGDCLEPAAGYGVPCFHYDCDEIGEIVGKFTKKDGKWGVEEA